MAYWKDTTTPLGLYFNPQPAIGSIAKNGILTFSPNLLLRLSQFFNPLLGHTRSRGKCWAAIPLSHHPDPWIGHWSTTWSTVWSSAPHSQPAGEAIPHLCKPEWKHSTLVRRRLSRTHAVLGRVIPRGWVFGVGNESTPSCKVVQPLRLLLVIRPIRRTYVVVVRWTDELCGEHKWAFRFETLCVCTRWTRERWVEQVSRLKGTACKRKCSSFATKLSRLDACKNRKVVRCGVGRRYPVTICKASSILKTYPTFCEKGLTSSDRLLYLKINQNFLSMVCPFDINPKNAWPTSLCVNRSKGHTIYKHRLTRTLLWRYKGNLSEVRVSLIHKIS